MRVIDCNWRHGTHETTTIGIIDIVVCGNGSTNEFTIRCNIFRNTTSTFIDSKVICSSTVIIITTSRGLCSSLSLIGIRIIVAKGSTTNLTGILRTGMKNRNLNMVILVQLWIILYSFLLTYQK